MVSSTVLTLIVIPAIYAAVKGWRLPEAEAGTGPAAGPLIVRVDVAAA